MIIEIKELNDLKKVKEKEVKVVGKLTKLRKRLNKNGRAYCIIELEDLSFKFDFYVFGEVYRNNKAILILGNVLELSLNVSSEFSENLVCNVIDIKKIKTNYNSNFIDVVEKCSVNGSYVGNGNPNAKILFVGKESAIDESAIEQNGCYSNNAVQWKEQISKQDCFGLRYLPQEPALKKPGHTWRKYQRLHDYIFNEKESNHEINFLENVFTTEMSDLPNKRTYDAQQKENFWGELHKRKNAFFKSEFIKSFEIIVLACHNYIWNNKQENQMKEIFDADFNYYYETKTTKKPQRFYVHTTSDNRLVIHTNQLSGSVASNELLKELGKVINNFGIEQDIF